MLRLYDTRHRRIEEIRPAQPGVLRVYGCGPTVYNHQHVGNMRTYLMNDLIVRVARLSGLRVDLVVNITDVGHVTGDVLDVGEDKMLVGARREGVSVSEVARRYEAAFHADLSSLNMLPATHSPRASDYIGRMIELVHTLLDRGRAYVGGDGTVYFDVRTFPSYGEISGNRLADLRPSQEEGLEEAKRFHADWALWKSVPPDAPVVFDSPWGPGFPGWHLECSAMSYDLLGGAIDVHTGGIDLRFPHHEDERAQTESAVGHEVVRHWVHGELLQFEGRKMAKSTGNVVLVSDVAAAGLDPLAVRLAMMRAGYRQQVNLDWDQLRQADRTLRRWRGRLAGWARAPSGPMDPALRGRVADLLAADLDTVGALVALQELERDAGVADGVKFETFNHFDQVLGLDLVREVGAPPAELPDGAAELLAERAAARTAGRWSDADRLRDELARMGVQVADTREGQVARPA